MLQELRVKNLALIEEAQIEFNKNLNILTGETGAGKSILLGSINLGLGKRANKDLIKDENKETYVELVFQSKDDNVIIKRSIGKDRSYAKVNGENVSLNELKDFTSKLINIYGQHDGEELRDDSKHINFLDEYGNKTISPLKTDVNIKYNEYKKAKELMKDFQLDEDKRLQEIDILKYQTTEIENANLVKGEEEELEKKYKKYSSSKTIIESLNNAISILRANEIDKASSEIKKAMKYDEGLTGLFDSLNDANAVISDSLRELDSLVDSYDINEEDFYLIENRLDTIRNTITKYGGNVENCLKTYEEKVQKLKILNDYDNERQKVLKKIEETKNQLENACEKLSLERKKCAKEFEEKIKEELKDLGFNEVKFEIAFDKKEEMLKDGYDEVTFMVSLNVGEKLKPLTDIASGGELSRIMLSIKTILADSDNTNTLIFDEIDQGISGITAAKVADKLKKISKKRQVICITHLPQIASKADNHFLIKKIVKDNHTFTSVNKLDYEGSIEEIARLLSCDGKITKEALANARDFKK